MFALIYAIIRATIETRLQRMNMPTDSSFYENVPENLQKESNYETPDI